MFNDAEKTWEAFPGRESGGSRNMSDSRGGGGNAAPAVDSLWEDGNSLKDDRYKGLTPPISPAQVRGRARLGLGAHHVKLWPKKRLYFVLYTCWPLGDTRDK